MSFITVLALILLILKLTGVIAWSWWFVLLPVYGPLVFMGAGYAFGLGLLILAAGLYKVITSDAYKAATK